MWNCRRRIVFRSNVTFTEEGHRMSALPYPPIADAFLGMFGATLASVVWENPSLGIFGVVVGTSGRPQQFPMPAHPPPVPPIQEMVVELPTDVTVPSIPETERSAEPPRCVHGMPTLRRTVMRRESPNLGRDFYVCTQPGRCSFFRWADEMAMFSAVRPASPVSAADVRAVTANVDPAEQLEAWAGVSQGSQRWHRLRAGRVTASNFGAANSNNQFCSPHDLLRNLLWPTHMDSVAMRYGSINEDRITFIGPDSDPAPSRLSGGLPSGLPNTVCTQSGRALLMNRGSGCVHSIRTLRDHRTRCIMRHSRPFPRAVAPTTGAVGASWRSRHRGSCATARTAPISTRFVINATGVQTASRSATTTRCRGMHGSWVWATSTSLCLRPVASMWSLSHTPRGSLVGVLLSVIRCMSISSCFRHWSAFGKRRCFRLSINGTACHQTKLHPDGCHPVHGSMHWVHDDTLAYFFSSE